MKIFLKRIFQYGCYIVFAVCTLYLTLLSLFSTSAVQMKKVVAKGENPRWESYNYFLPDSPWKYLIAAAVFLLLLAVFIRISNKLKMRIELSWLCIIFFALWVLFILAADLYPISDSGKVLTIARQLKEHNFEQFGIRGYMYRYPDQAGIVLIYYFIHCIFGTKDYLVIQIINAALLAGAYYIIGKTAQLLWGEKDKNVQNITVILYILFFPAALYVTLVYGTIPGFAFGAAAFYLQLKFMKSGSLANIVAAGVCISAAVIWKTNSLIMLIAMLIYLMYDLVTGLKDKKKKSFIAILIIILINLISSFTVNTLMQQITKTQVSKGMPKTAWIAMGLHETGFAPGVWNGYSVGLFEDNNYKYEETDFAARKEIEVQFANFMNDKSYAVDFFGRKNAMQWNNPTFNCLGILEGREDENGVKFDNLCFGPLKYKIIKISDYLQSLILLGACLYLILKRKEQGTGEMLLGITVAGGMIFHMLWEAKPQYVLPYFLLILPYAAAGYSAAASKILDVWDERINDMQSVKKKCFRAVFGIGIVCFLLGIIPLASKFRIISYTVYLQNEPERLKQYEEAVWISLQEYEERK